MKGVRLLFAVYCPFPSIFLGVVIQAEDRGEGVLLICIHIYLVLLDERGGFATWSCRSHFDMSLLEMFFLELNFSHCQFRWSSLKKKKTGKKTPKSFDSEEKDSRICKMGSGREHRDGLNAAESSDLILKQIA